jgi:hypothetical protein
MACNQRHSHAASLIHPFVMLSGGEAWEVPRFRKTATRLITANFRVAAAKPMIRGKPREPPIRAIEVIRGKSIDRKLTDAMQYSHQCFNWPRVQDRPFPPEIGPDSVHEIERLAGVYNIGSI